jgi:hypothetical protein
MATKRGTIASVLDTDVLKDKYFGGPTVGLDPQVGEKLHQGFSTGESSKLKKSVKYWSID